MIQSSQFYGYTVMSSLMSQIRSLFRPVSKVRGSNNNSEVFLRRVRLCLLTAVAGYDNKHTKYSTRISPKWVYGDDACFLSVTDSSYVLGKSCHSNKQINRILWRLHRVFRVSEFFNQSFINPNVS